MADGTPTTTAYHSVQISAAGVVLEADMAVPRIRTRRS
jgi:hypothetical protein